MINSNKQLMCSFISQGNAQGHKQRVLSVLALVCLILVLGLTTENVKANSEQRETDFAAIDAYVTEQMKRLGIPGLALGIVQDGQMAHLRGFGVADSSGRAVTPQTPFYIGSVTKSFTALAVMQLVEAGEIDLGTSVQTYLPWFELADKEASAQITVRHLLNHTTGISTQDGERGNDSQQGLEELVRGLGNLSLTAPVGTTYQYSNLNYNIAGLIVEAVSGQSYAEYVTEQIFGPLDMRHSYASRAPALKDGLAQGHAYMFGHAFGVEEPLLPARLPSGYVIASVEDLAHYAMAQLNDGRYGDISVLSPQGMAELHAPAIPVDGGEVHYAMGWLVGTLDGRPHIEHGGALRSFRSQIILLPESGRGVILLANAHGFEQLMQVPELAKGVVRLLNGEPAAPVTLSFRVRFLYWAVLLTPLWMIGGITYSGRYWRNKGAGHILLVVLLYSGIALLWLIVLPRLLGVSIWSVFRIEIFYRELAYGVVASAVLGIGWSVVYTAMNLVARRRS